jgi:hypothetical protein
MRVAHQLSYRLTGIKAQLSDQELKIILLLRKQSRNNRKTTTQHL